MSDVILPKCQASNWLLVCIALCAVYLIYLPGISGALYYDDYGNLGALSDIKDWDAAKEFVLGGSAGPLGRPIALLTFLPHAEGWPDNSSAMLHVNVLIHVANTLLLFLLGRGILQLLQPHQVRLNFRIAISAALLWAVLPLLVSSTLITIQRMTGLAALFGLLGLVGFVHGYRIAQARPLFGMLVQLGALGAGTLLSIFSKENGALVPVFALVIDVVLLRSVPYALAYRRCLRLALGGCLAILLIYLSPLWRDWSHVSTYRGFSPWERLQTQVVLVWEYLFHAFLPQRPTVYGPFRDAVGLMHNFWLAGTAAVGWLLALLGAAAVRRVFPWLLFGLLWFWTGHLLESTVILLELAFEHRNYLAVYGFCLMLAWLAWNASGKLSRLAPWLFATYVLMLSAITLSMTVLWGNPSKAAESWVNANPGSARAALHAAFVELGPTPKGTEDLTQDLLRHQGMQRAMTILDRTSGVCPDCLSVKAQAMAYACRLSDDEDILRRYEDLRMRASSGEVSIPVVDVFFPLYQLVELKSCGPLDYSHLLSFAEEILKNPQSRSQMYTTRLHFIAAMNAQKLGDWKRVEDHLERGESAGIEAMPILQFQVHHFVEHGDFKAAKEAIARRREVASIASNPSNVKLLNELQAFVANEAKQKNVSANAISRSR